MKESFQASAWNNGLHRRTGGGYGIKLRLKDRDKYFDKKYNDVILYLETSPQKIIINIKKKSFWNSSRELSHSEIGLWLIANKKAPWPKNDPPSISLKYLGKNEFKATLEK